MTRMTMTSVAFDTLSYARRLKAAGVDEAQAEAHAEAVRDAVTEGVATKDDVGVLKDDLDRGLAAAKADLDKGLGELKAEFKADMAELRADLDRGLANLETRLVRLIFAVAAGQVALIVGLLKLLP